METRIENIAAGNVTSIHSEPTEFQNLAHYAFGVSILDSLMSTGELSEDIHHKACDVLAYHYGISENSIFR